jgi:hypothetical protein
MDGLKPIPTNPRGLCLVYARDESRAYRPN